METKDNILVMATNEDIVDGRFVVSEGIVRIEDWAFRGCTSLQQIIFPCSLREIGRFAFVGRTSLTNLVLPEGLEMIGCGAFRDCTSLQSIALPPSLEKIGYGAFRGCASLNDVQGSNRELVNQVRLQTLMGRRIPTEVVDGWREIVKNAQG